VYRRDRLRWQPHAGEHRRVLFGLLDHDQSNDSIVRSGEVNVETFKGEVQLSGFVSSKASMDQAVVVARNVQGVTSVKNDMRIK
jgi:hypothetical protein